MLMTISFAQETTTTAPGLDELQKMAVRFAPTPLQVDTSALSAGDKKALVKLVQAARIVNHLFMNQFWSGDVALYEKLQRDYSALGKARLHYFWINKGPWSEIDEHKAFLPDVPAKKPAGANFYPEDMSKDEFESWVKTLSAEDKAEAEGFFSVIRRDANRKLKLVPYSQEYKTDLDLAGRLLREAATLTDNASLKKFLTTRADAFSSNNYYESDMAWMDLDAPVDVTFGPYETYNDEIFGYKAAFEAYINIRDDQETAKLSFFGQHLQEIENNLPEDPQYRNAKLGALAPIRVVNEVFGAGDGNHGVQTAAYNLPNDDKVVQQKGSKRVMLKNVQQAKFKATLLPISKVVLQPGAQKDVNFDLFFTHIVAHEITHGLGPHQIKINGRDTNPRLELKDLYSAIEEAKADVTGLFALQFLMTQTDKGAIQSPLPMALTPNGSSTLRIWHRRSAPCASAFRTRTPKGWPCSSTTCSIAARMWPTPMARSAWTSQSERCSPRSRSRSADAGSQRRLRRRQEHAGQAERNSPGSQESPRPAEFPAHRHRASVYNRRFTHPESTGRRQRKRHRERREAIEEINSSQMRWTQRAEGDR